jgi:hypothetical protein
MCYVVVEDYIFQLVLFHIKKLRGARPGSKLETCLYIGNFNLIFNLQVSQFLFYFTCPKLSKTGVICDWTGSSSSSPSMLLIL